MSSKSSKAPAVVMEEMVDDEDDEEECPLCSEEFDLSDKNFLPCPCGYRVCMWCWHHIRANLNGLCPACRTPYNADPHAFTGVDRTEIVKKNRERRAKEKQEKKADVARTPSISGAAGGSSMGGVGVGSGAGGGSGVGAGGGGSGASLARPGVVNMKEVERKHLHNYRVVQRNLVYVIGLPATLCTEEILRKPEYFGQYGKVGKVIIHRCTTGAQPSVSAYITFSYKEDAKASIQSLEGHWLDGHLLRASFGTTKYCNSFIRGLSCTNPECVYLHEMGNEEDRFTKAEIQAGHSKLEQVPGQNQTIITGMGGPSGTGKRPVGEPILPPPVFIADLNPGKTNLGRPSTWPSAHAASAPSAARPGSPSASETTASTGPVLTWGLNKATLKALSPLPSPPTPDAESLLPPESPPLRPLPSPAIPVLSNNNNGKSTSSDKLSSSSNNNSNSGSISSGSVASISSTSSSSEPVTSRKGMTRQEKTAEAFRLRAAAAEEKAQKEAAAAAAAAAPAIAATDTSLVMGKTPATAASMLAAALLEKEREYASARSKQERGIGVAIVGPTSASGEEVQQLMASCSFSGLGRCAVFTVPVSSVTGSSIWAKVLSSSTSTLEIDPYGQLLVPISELLDLTLPPVDAVSIEPSWPRPMSYYSQGTSEDGSTHCTVRRHVHRETFSEGALASQHVDEPFLVGSGATAAPLLPAAPIAPSAVAPVAPQAQEAGLKQLQSLFPGVIVVRK